ncbi:MAG: hypothetical protein GX638_09020 [Crenarchaeota archaeon]|nr:hypothetical protein [Thermoproteota archaeon]
MNTNYNWHYGESEYQRYFECEINNDKIILFANKYKDHNPNMFMAHIVKDGKLFMVGNKTYNDRQRKKYKTPNDCNPPVYKLLASEDIEYMKQKSITCYEQNKLEISQ